MFQVLLVCEIVEHEAFPLEASRFPVIDKIADTFPSDSHVIEKLSFMFFLLLLLRYYLLSKISGSHRQSVHFFTEVGDAAGDDVDNSLFVF